MQHLVGALAPLARAVATRVARTQQPASTPWPACQAPLDCVHSISQPTTAPRGPPKAFTSQGVREIATSYQALSPIQASKRLSLDPHSGIPSWSTLLEVNNEDCKMK